MEGETWWTFVVVLNVLIVIHNSLDVINSP
jgi:hypothetical protein